jgi:hypothetical protein
LSFESIDANTLPFSVKPTLILDLSIVDSTRPFFSSQTICFASWHNDIWNNCDLMDLIEMKLTKD